MEFLWGLWSPGWDYPSERIEAVTGTLRTENAVEHAVQYYRDTVRSQAASLAGSLVGPGRPSLDAVQPVRTRRSSPIVTGTAVSVRNCSHTWAR